jgi:hypothetical protein
MVLYLGEERVRELLNWDQLISTMWRRHSPLSRSGVFCSQCATC